uniref:Sodium/iodide cotransporter n=1 Tax=Macrostomum lignano TaxID=282301 RepID=A0A1I8FQ50_9PLAT
AVVDSGGFGQMWQLNMDYGRLQLPPLTADPRERHSLWGMIFGQAMYWLIQVAERGVRPRRPLDHGQRVHPGGLAIFGRYASVACDIHTAGWADTNQIVTYYVMERMNVPGFPGLFTAALLAAALSSVSSSLSSVSTIAWTDLLRPYACKKPQPVSSARRWRNIVAQLGGTIIQAVTTFLGAAAGPSVGLFLLGCLFPACANWLGAAVGPLVGLACSMWVGIGPTVSAGRMFLQEYIYTISYVWTPVAWVVLVTVSVGLVCSCLTRRSSWLKCGIEPIKVQRRHLLAGVARLYEAAGCGGCLAKDEAAGVGNQEAEDGNLEKKKSKSAVGARVHPLEQPSKMLAACDANAAAAAAVGAAAASGNAFGQTGSAAAVAAAAAAGSVVAPPPPPPKPPLLGSPLESLLAPPATSRPASNQGLLGLRVHEAASAAPALRLCRQKTIIHNPASLPDNNGQNRSRCQAEVAAHFGAVASSSEAYRTAVSAQSLDPAVNGSCHRLNRTVVLNRTESEPNRPSCEALSRKRTAVDDLWQADAGIPGRSHRALIQQPAQSPRDLRRRKKVATISACRCSRLARPSLRHLVWKRPHLRLATCALARSSTPKSRRMSRCRRPPSTLHRCISGTIRPPDSPLQKTHQKKSFSNGGQGGQPQLQTGNFPSRSDGPASMCRRTRLAFEFGGSWVKSTIQIIRQSSEPLATHWLLSRPLCMQAVAHSISDLTPVTFSSKLLVTLSMKTESVLTSSTWFTLEADAGGWNEHPFEYFISELSITPRQLPACQLTQRTAAEEQQQSRANDLNHCIVEYLDISTLPPKSGLLSCSVSLAISRASRSLRSVRPQYIWMPYTTVPTTAPRKATQNGTAQHRLEAVGTANAGAGCDARRQEVQRRGAAAARPRCTGRAPRKAEQKIKELAERFKPRRRARHCDVVHLAARRLRFEGRFSE